MSDREDREDREDHEDRDGRIVPYDVRRRGTADYMRMAGTRSNVHGLVEVDVTEARARIDAQEAATGETRSFTAFLVHCLAAAIQEHPRVNSYLDWRGRLHTFDDVDVNVLIETGDGDDRRGVPHVLRGTDDRSLESIHGEMRATQRDGGPAGSSGSSWLSTAFFRLPGLVRRQVWRLPRLHPRTWKRLAGTVAVTAVGMFGSGSGWAISPTNYAVQLTVGGISTKPRYVDGDLEPRELLSLTVTFDHDVIDGAPAARFVQTLCDRIEDAHGLDGP